MAAPLLRAGPVTTGVTFEEALARYRTTTRWPARVRIEAANTVQRIGGLGDVRGRYDILFWKEGDQIDATQTYYDLIATPHGGERAGPVIDAVRIVYDRKLRQYLHYQIYSPGGPRQHQEIAQFGTTEAGLNSAFWMLGTGRELSGYIDGDDSIHLADVMARGTNRTIRTETLSHGGRPLIVLEADTPFGHHALWLDPEADDAPRRIEVTRTRQDRYEWGMLPEGIVRQRIVIDECRFQSGETYSIPAHMKSVEEQVDQAGKVTRWERVFDVRKVDLVPDDSQDKGAFRLDAPDGTSVSPAIPLWISYEWRGGKIVTVRTKE
jgi:hypothetical protein